MAAVKLELFETDEAGPCTPETVQDQIEEDRLAAYEAGYTAGWEDAATAAADDAARLGVDLARHLQSMNFTFQEARIHVLRSVEPLLVQMADRLLPVIAREVLAPVIVENLLPLAEHLADRPVTLLVHPAARAAVEGRLGGIGGLPLTIVDEPSLSEGQAYLRLGGAEAVLVDMDRAAQHIADTLRGFFELSPVQLPALPLSPKAGP